MAPRQSKHDGTARKDCPIATMTSYICDPDSVRGTIQDPVWNCKDVVRFFEMYASSACRCVGLTCDEQVSGTRCRRSTGTLHRRNARQTGRAQPVSLTPRRVGPDLTQYRQGEDTKGQDVERPTTTSMKTFRNWRFADLDKTHRPDACCVVHARCLGRYRWVS